MRRHALVLVSLVCLLVSGAVGVFARHEFGRLVATTSLVVAGAEIPAYTLITPELLTTREMARTLEQEPVYRRVEEVAGKISTGFIQAGALIYTSQAVAPAAFRLTDDERLEVVSFPVKPERAAGGQVRVGHRINIYRIALAVGPGKPDASPEELLSQRSAAVEVLARDVPVVDVRSTQGEPAGELVGRSHGQSQMEQQAAAAPRYVPMSIITVAVPPAVAMDLVRLMGETRGRYELWVTLAPLM